MRIIKQGRDPAAELHEATCSNCGTVFEFNSGEARLQSDHRNGEYFEIACPLCGHRVTKEVQGCSP
ncbi:CpXC domain-containing protein [Xanthomonas sp. MWU16-30325]|uniref:CpXC domain-containing protein n=1 Tax=Xanthomonas sp. MWU16-30325 TaxID=2878096 RepID=UPI001CF813E5|nr:CpXC domain-containing protein [Xanthomonas sp. MWU16-30325]